MQGGKVKVVKYKYMKNLLQYTLGLSTNILNWNIYLNIKKTKQRFDCEN